MNDKGMAEFELSVSVKNFALELLKQWCCPHQLTCRPKLNIKSNICGDITRFCSTPLAGKRLFAKRCAIPLPSKVETAPGCESLCLEVTAVRVVTRHVCEANVEGPFGLWPI